MENEVLLKLVKYFEMSPLKSRENKQFYLICILIAKSMSNPILFYRISIARLVAEQLTSFKKGGFLKTGFPCSFERVAESP